jgi:hypothetical protein
MEEHEREDEDEHAILKDEQSFIDNISRFYGETDLCDITLKIGEDSYPAHKFVLAKDSDVFKTMLYHDRWSQDNQLMFFHFLKIYREKTLLADDFTVYK